jgi:hypothetical protein
MLKSEPEVNRRQLRFEEAVLAGFDFLRSHGFKLVETGPTLVRFESRKVFVNIYHGRASYEIGVEVGLKARSEKYGLDYIVSWAGETAWKAEGFGRSTMFQVSSWEGVQRIVPRVAEIVRKYGEPFLGGDARFYGQLDDANRRASAEFTKRQHLAAIRKLADAAWSEKNFSRLYELYQSIEEDLTAIESKRLSYARKQTRPSPDEGGG